MKLDQLKDFFKNYQEVSLKLKNSNESNILQYLDRDMNAWSMHRFEEALDQAVIACELNKNTSSAKHSATVE